MKLKDFDFRMWDKRRGYFTKMQIDKNALERIEVELWSGLYDDKGVKIYENDIVKSTKPSGEISYFLFVSIRIGEEFKIEKIEPGKSISYKSCLDEMTGEFNVDECCYENTLEVIGNIHDNHNLFKVVK